MKAHSVVIAAILCSCSATAPALADEKDKPNRIERTANRAVEGTKKTAVRAGKFVEKTATRAGKFVERTATKADKAVRRAIE